MLSCPNPSSVAILAPSSSFFAFCSFLSGILLYSVLVRDRAFWMDNNGGQGDVTLNPTIDFIAGTIAGMTSLVVGFPFDTVKVRFQTPEIASKYTSTAQAIARIIREERFIGLYKGIMSPLATVALMNGLVFSSYRFLLKLQLSHADAVPTISQVALAGAGSGIVSSIVTAPTELVKIRQQSLLTPTTARQVAAQMFREQGVRGLYRGLPVTALRDCGYGAYFAAYEFTCRYFSTPSAGAGVLAQVEKELNALSWTALLFAGGVAGIVGWIATFPLDVVKTRMQGSSPILEPFKMPYATAQSQPRPPTLTSTSRMPLLAKQEMRDVNPYRTIWSTISHSYRNEGIGVFFRGLSPTIIRAIPVNMVTFATFEGVVKAFS